VGLGLTGDAAVIALYVISGSLYAFIAIVSALSANAIRKEKSCYDVASFNRFLDSYSIDAYL